MPRYAWHRCPAQNNIGEDEQRIEAFGATPTATTCLAQEKLKQLQRISLPSHNQSQPIIHAALTTQTTEGLEEAHDGLAGSSFLFLRR